MYCIKCGVELQKGEDVCPLCGIKMSHPELQFSEGEKTYPIKRVPSYESVNKKGLLFIITMAFALVTVGAVMCDIALNERVIWSGYAVGGVVLLYLLSVLPAWFEKPNSVIFVPTFFGAVILYLLYINIATSGSWFLSFAFPTVGVLGLGITAFCAVVKYAKRGYWYVAGAAVLAIGAYTVLIEFLLIITFGIQTRFPWSTYPLAACIIIGSGLMTIAISPALRRRVQKKFFI